MDEGGGGKEREREKNNWLTRTKLMRGGVGRLGLSSRHQRGKEPECISTVIQLRRWAFPPSSSLHCGLFCFVFLLFSSFLFSFFFPPRLAVRRSICASPIVHRLSPSSSPSTTRSGSKERGGKIDNRVAGTELHVQFFRRLVQLTRTRRGRCGTRTRKKKKKKKRSHVTRQKQSQLERGCRREKKMK